MYICTLFLFIYRHIKRNKLYMNKLMVKTYLYMNIYTYIYIFIFFIRINIYMAMRPPKRWSQELARTNQRTASRSTAGKVHICYKSAWTRDWDNVGCGIGTMLDPPKTAPWQDLGTIQLKLLFYSLSSFGTSFRSQKGATKVAGTSKMEPKGVPKRAKEASKTPLRSMIEKILKKCAKRCKLGCPFLNPNR